MIGAAGDPVIIAGTYLGVWCMVLPAVLGGIGAAVMNVRDRKRVKR